MIRCSKSLYAGHRFPAEVISHVVWLYHRFPLSLRMVEEMLAMRGIMVSHETIRQWGLKFGREFAARLRRRRPQAGDKWHLDEMAVKIAGRTHWLWRAVDQQGFVLDVLIQSRRDGSVALADCGRDEHGPALLQSGRKTKDLVYKGPLGRHVIPGRGAYLAPST